MADKNDPDITLMLRVKEGDLSAYETLIDKFKQPVMNLVYRLIHDIDEAEDIAQNVLFKSGKLAIDTSLIASLRLGYLPLLEICL